MIVIVAIGPCNKNANDGDHGDDGGDYGCGWGGRHGCSWLGMRDEEGGCGIGAWVGGAVILESKAFGG